MMNAFAMLKAYFFLLRAKLYLSLKLLYAFTNPTILLFYVKKFWALYINYGLFYSKNTVLPYSEFIFKSNPLLLRKYIQKLIATYHFTNTDIVPYVWDSE